MNEMTVDEAIALADAMEAAGFIWNDSRPGEYNVSRTDFIFSCLGGEIVTIDIEVEL